MNTTIKIFTTSTSSVVFPRPRQTTSKSVHNTLANDSLRIRGHMQPSGHSKSQHILFQVEVDLTSSARCCLSSEVLTSQSWSASDPRRLGRNININRVNLRSTFQVAGGNQSPSEIIALGMLIPGGECSFESATWLLNSRGMRKRACRNNPPRQNPQHIKCQS